MGLNRNKVLIVGNKPTDCLGSGCLCVIDEGPAFAGKADT